MLHFRCSRHSVQGHCRLAKYEWPRGRGSGSTGGSLPSPGETWEQEAFFDHPGWLQPHQDRDWEAWLAQRKGREETESSWRDKIRQKAADSKPMPDFPSIWELSPIWSFFPCLRALKTLPVHQYVLITSSPLHQLLPVPFPPFISFLFKNK